MKQIIDINKLNISTEKVVQEIYKGTEANELVVEIIDLLINEVVNTCKPFVWIEEYDLVRCENVLLINNEEFKVGKIISEVLNECERVIVFIGSVGAEFDTLISKIRERKDIVQEFVIDIIGSILADSISYYVKYFYEDQIGSKKTYFTLPLSPGYCNWNIKEQLKLFSLINDNEIGVKLSPSCLMIPIKSVSGIIGVSTKPQKLKYGCEICTSKKCYKNKLNN